MKHHSFLLLFPSLPLPPFLYVAGPARSMRKVLRILMSPSLSTGLRDYASSVNGMSQERLILSCPLPAVPPAHNVLTIALRMTNGILRHEIDSLTSSYVDDIANTGRVGGYCEFDQQNELLEFCAANNRIRIQFDFRRRGTNSFWFLLSSLRFATSIARLRKETTRWSKSLSNVAIVPNCFVRRRRRFFL